VACHTGSPLQRGAAQPSKLVQLHLEWTEQHVDLSISNNGQGFEMNSHEHTGFGLRSIGERIEQLGGTMLIQSARGARTRIAIRCPLLPTTGDAPSEQKATT
jgi:two-component system, NarL family, sensor histidine kinase LiaS